MSRPYAYQHLPYAPAPEQVDGRPRHYAVAVVGAGPVGLTAAIDLARRGVRAVLLDGKDRVSDGSRAICFAKRTLEVFDRLGCVGPMRAKGVTWSRGRLFYQGSEVYHFDLLPESGHAHPAFINLQQYHLEEYLIAALERLPGSDARWQHRVARVEASDDGARLAIATPDGEYELTCDYVLACDGAHSPIRKALGLDYKGIQFEERFLIADVVMKAGFPAERWFMFEPSFHTGNVLLHMQPDNVWRIDFQLGRDADPAEEVKPERVIPRIRAMLGPDVAFDLEWVSLYTFHSRRMDRFAHGRVIFAGDAAHIVSPFGARGANSGIQDADNLAWKLALVLDGRAPASLIESYNHERVAAARENLWHTETSTEFIAPAGPGRRALRDAVLTLAKDYAFARPLINSGRLSTPAVYADSPLNTPDEDTFTARVRPGAAAIDAPVAQDGSPGYLLPRLGGDFTVMLCAPPPGETEGAIAMLRALERDAIPARGVIVSPDAAPGAVHDVEGAVRERYDCAPGTTYLFRPDQHVCARWRAFDAGKVRAAIARATGQPQP